MDNSISKVKSNISHLDSISKQNTSLTINASPHDSSDVFQIASLLKFLADAPLQIDQAILNRQFSRSASLYIQTRAATVTFEDSELIVISVLLTIISRQLSRLLGSLFHV